MKIAWAMSAITLCIAGCDNSAFDNAIKESVRAKLKDPDSAKFKDEIVVRSRACISVNAKNSYGGYTGYTIAHLQKLGSGQWYVESVDGEPCNAYVLERKLAIDKADEEAEKAILEKLKTQDLVDATVQSVLSIKDKKCRELASDLMATIRLSNSEWNEERKKWWQAQANQKMAVIDAGSCK